MSVEATAYLNALASEEASIARCSSDVVLPSAEKPDSSFLDSDEELLQQVNLGSRESLGILFKKYARSVRNVAQSILRDEAEADDLLQEVFLFIFHKANLFDPLKGSARSWIFYVAYHRAFDQRRYLASRHFYSSQDIETSAPELIDYREELPFYERSIAGLWGKEASNKLHALLSEDQRTTFELYFFEGYSLKEIAERMGQSLASVRHHYYRGLDKIRKSALATKLRSK
jgi:RNA polymerase sigma-70 factor, ECF subfamily